MNDISPIDQIDVIITDALEKDDPDLVFHQIAELERKRELIEAAKSKFFFTLNEVWDKFSVSKHGETVHSRAEYNLGMHPFTVDRYITMWQFQGQLPDSIQDRPVREKFSITKMLSQGYEPTEEQWEDLERTNTKAEVDEVLRQIKGTEPRKGSLQIYVDRMGTLYAWKDGKRENCGFLDINSRNEIVQQAVERIKNSAGILKKG